MIKDFRKKKKKKKKKKCAYDSGLEYKTFVFILLMQFVADYILGRTDFLEKKIEHSASFTKLLGTPISKFHILIWRMASTILIVTLKWANQMSSLGLIKA